jgi:hypothetical protein
MIKFGRANNLMANRVDEWVLAVFYIAIERGSGASGELRFD